MASRKEIAASLERLNFAIDRVANMDASQRAELTAERLIRSFGVTHDEAERLIRQHRR
jgi:hypothetical protein